MWDYSFIVPCALMMLTLLAFYFSRSRLPISLNRTFLSLLVVQLLVLLSDIVSTRVDEFYEQFTPVTLYVCNTLFFVFYLARIYLFFQFTLNLLNVGREKHRAFVVLSCVPICFAEFVSITSFATGAVFSVVDGAYKSGPWYVILAIIYFLYIGLALAVILAKAKGLRRKDLVCALAFNFALLAGTAVRLLLPRVLVMDTFCMVAITIVYLAFLNPDLYIAEAGGAFNIRGFRTLLAEPSRQRNYYVLGFAIANYSQERSILGIHQTDKLIGGVCRFVSKRFPELILFYLRGGRFVLVGNERTDWGVVRIVLAERFTQPWIVGDSNLRVNVSFSYVDSESSSETAEDMFGDFMIALDSARLSVGIGADTAQNPLSVKQVNRQMDVLRSLENAIENDEVEVFLQPIMDGITHELVGAEALARIRDQQGIIISPGEFIPLAEKSGHINQLGHQVLCRTCAFIKAHDMDALGLQWINVNLSPWQCVQQDLAEQFYSVLDEYCVPVERIRLELTEQSMTDFSVLQQQILALQSEGFRFVLDDYGSGYSNLTRVKHYPFITVKLDMEVVWDFFHERDNLLPTIVQGFRQMGLSIAAEGIETAEMADVLTGIGSDYLQGFYFSKPLPPEEFELKYGRATVWS